jgi:hypothetical protein
MRCVLANDDRDDLFVTIEDGDKEWAEIYPDVRSRRFILTIFPLLSGEEYVFDLSEVENALLEGRRRLEERGYPLPVRKTSEE